MDERVERGMRRQLAAAPPDRIGWKMALNAPAAMEALGLEEPALGWLSRSRVATGEHGLEGSMAPAVEPELVVEAGENGTVARVGAAIEVVDFDRALDELEEVIAENVFHRAVAFGELVPATGTGGAVFSVNGDERARVAEIEPPERTLAFVADFLARLGTELAPGELVIAGALSAPVPVSAGDVAELAIDAVGPVALRF
jgi:2-keto-4-pentenoate hydratase